MSLPVYNFKTAIDNPQLLKDRVVVVGGIYGTSDRFYFRGIEQPAYGVMLHGWITHNELFPPKGIPDSAALAIDVWVGMATGGLFGLIWAAMARQRNSYARRAGLYLAFMLLAVGSPLLLVLGAVVAAAEYGVLIGAAAMIVSVMFDSFLSSQEKLLSGTEGEDPGKRGRSRPAVAGRARMRSAALVLAGFAVGLTAVMALVRNGDSLTVCAAVGMACALFMVWARQDGRRRHTRTQAAVRAGHGLDTTPVWSDAARVIWLALRLGAILGALAIQPGNGLAATLAGSFFATAGIFFLVNALRAGKSGTRGFEIRR